MMMCMRDDYLNIKVSDWNEEKPIAICIISIIREEMLEIVNLFKMKPKKGTYIYWEGYWSEHPNVIIHCYQQNESSNIFSAGLTEYVLKQSYDYYFCVGTSGAVQARLYDVIIADQIIYLEKGANSLEGKEYDGKALEITEKEKNIINTFLTQIAVTNKFDFFVDKAPIFSGENVEKNPKVKDLLEARSFARHLAAIDMESFGVFQALRFYQSFEGDSDKFITIIRGISDKADTLKNGVYEDGLSADERKKCAMKNVLKILIEFIAFLSN